MLIKLASMVSVISLVASCQYFKSSEYEIPQNESLEREELLEEIALNGDEPYNYRCESAKELITTYNYLSKRNVYATNRESRLKISSEVAKGCSGAARKFIKTSELLLRAKIDPSTALKHARRFSSLPKEPQEAFVEIFKLMYSRDKLNQSAYRSLTVASKLTESFPKDAKIYAEDFEDFVDFCKVESKLSMTPPECADLAVKFVGYSVMYKDRVFDLFEEGFEFLTEDDDGPKLVSNEALKALEEFMKVSPYAAKNFSETYKFSVSERGLKYSRDKAVNFSKKIALLTKGPNHYRKNK